MHDGRKIKLLNQQNSWKRVFLTLALPVLQCQIKKLAMIGMHVSTSWILKNHEKTTPSENGSFETKQHQHRGVAKFMAGQKKRQILMEQSLRQTPHT